MIQSFVSGDLILVKSIQLQNWSLGNIGNTGIQEYRNEKYNTVIQKYRNTGIQYIIQEYRDNTGIHGYNIWYRNTGIQCIQYGNTWIQYVIQEYRDTIYNRGIQGYNI